MEELEIVKQAVKTLDKHKVEDLTVLKIDDLTVISDYFIIATATSVTQIRALAGEIEDELEKLGRKVHHKEGADSASWILLDYGDFIVHLFLKDSRMFYSLERLWSDAHQIDAAEFVKE